MTTVLLNADEARKYRSLKGKLTRAIKADNNIHVAKVCREFLALTDGKAWPDDWHRFNIALLEFCGVDLDWMEAHPDAVPECAWFAACDREAVDVVPHPALRHKVPVCDKHKQWIKAMQSA